MEKNIIMKTHLTKTGRLLVVCFAVTALGLMGVWGARALARVENADQCKNHIRKLKECSKCHGTGEYMRLNRKVKCDKCNGDGWLWQPCPNCGRVEDPDPKICKNHITRITVNCPVCEGRGEIEKKTFGIFTKMVQCVCCHGTGKVGRTIPCPNCGRSE